MKNTQKGFIVPLLIAIIAVLAIGGGVYIWNWNYPNGLNVWDHYQTAPTSSDKVVGPIPSTLTDNDILKATYTISANFGGKKTAPQNVVLPYGDSSNRLYITENGSVLMNPSKPSGEVFWIYKYEYTDSTRTQAKVYVGGNFGASGQDNRVFIVNKINGIVVTKEVVNPVVVPSQPSVTVSSPNTGNSWVLGSSQTIKWTGNSSPRVGVSISLASTDCVNPITGVAICDPAVSYAPITVGTPLFDSGSYVWQVGKSQVTNSVAPGTYIIRVCQSDTNICGISKSFSIVSPVSSLPTTCIDQQEGVPVITSLSSNSVSVGTRLAIGGCNFAGFESDLNVWIENSQGIKGILYSEPGSTSKLMNIVLKSQACQTDESYRGLPCASYLNLTPGTYKIYTIPWGKKSNEAIFTIK